MSIICVCFLFKMQAQVFPKSDAIWSIKSDDIVVGPGQGDIYKGGVWYYGLSGDTIIGDKSYNKLYLLNDTTLNIDSKDIYVGGFRQEGKKVWFRPSSNFFSLSDEDDPPYPEETILYDFSKNVGDTIWHSFDTRTMKDSIAISVITSIDIDEQGHRIFHIESYEHYDSEFFPMESDTWIEGIGSIDHGLWWFLSPRPTCICPEPYLACFKQGNEVKYMDVRCNSCFPGATSILEKNIILLNVIYENNCIRIQGESSAFPCELKLFSLIGQPVLKKELQSNKEIIPVNHQKGIYLYRVQKNREIMKTGKLIIK